MFYGANFKSLFIGEKSKLRFGHRTFCIKDGIIFKTWRWNSFLDLDSIENNAMFHVLLIFRIKHAIINVTNPKRIASSLPCTREDPEVIGLLLYLLYTSR